MPNGGGDPKTAFYAAGHSVNQILDFRVFQDWLMTATRKCWNVLRWSAKPRSGRPENVRVHFTTVERHVGPVDERHQIARHSVEWLTPLGPRACTCVGAVVHFAVVDVDVARHLGCSRKRS